MSEDQMSPDKATESTESDAGPESGPTPARDAQDARGARPKLHHLYRFWTRATDGEEVDQEWDGWWSGRNWHALFDMGIWDPEFVVRWEVLADAELAPLRARVTELEAERDDLREFHRDVSAAIQPFEPTPGGVTVAERVTVLGRGKAVADQQHEHFAREAKIARDGRDWWRASALDWKARAERAEAALARVEALADKWESGERVVTLEWNEPIGATFARALRVALAAAGPAVSDPAKTEAKR